MQGQRVNSRRQEGKWDENACCDVHRESIKAKKKKTGKCLELDEEKEMGAENTRILELAVIKTTHNLKYKENGITRFCETNFRRAYDEKITM